MPSFKFGSRAAPAAAALLDYVQRRQEQTEESIKERRGFKERLVSALAQKGFLDPQSALSYDPMSGDTSRIAPLSLTIPNPQDLRPGETVSTPLPGGGRRTIRGLAPRATPPQKFLSESQAAKSFGTIQPGQPISTAVMPGQPFSGALPMTPAGINTFQSLIDRGMTESNAASLINQTPTPGVLDQLRQFLTAMGRGGAPDSPPRSAPVSLLARPSRISSAAQAAAIPQEELDDLQTLIEQGSLTSHDQAVALIQQAGFDAEDPAFDELLSQLP